MKTIQVTRANEMKICIPVSKITGITEVNQAIDEGYGNCFIATGADGDNGTENGWYVNEKYDVVKTMLEYHSET
jgi:hypothetical protein